MKASFRNQRQGCSAKHNDRTNVTYNKEKEKNNELYVYRRGELTQMRSNKNGTMERCEIQAYQTEFHEWLEKRNTREKQNNHYDRVKSMKEIYQSSRYKPEETIYQIGAGKEGTDLKDQDKFRKILFKTLEREQKEFPQIKILSVSIHADEDVLHAHVRKMYTTKNHEPGMEKCLEEMGIERPNLEKESGRHNNRKMTYTEKTREIWYSEIEKELGITLDRNVKQPSKKRQTKLEYECERLEQRLERTEQALKDLSELETIELRTKAKKAILKDLNKEVRLEMNHRTDDALRDRCAMMEQYLKYTKQVAQYKKFRDFLEEMEYER